MARDKNVRKGKDEKKVERRKNERVRDKERRYERETKEIHAEEETAMVSRRVMDASAPAKDGWAEAEPFDDFVPFPETRVKIRRMLEKHCEREELLTLRKASIAFASCHNYPSSPVSIIPKDVIRLIMSFIPEEEIFMLGGNVPHGANHEVARNDEVYKFSPSRKSWAKVTELPVTVSHFKSFFFEDQLMIAGGYLDDRATWNDKIWCYDLHSDTWSCFMSSIPYVSFCSIWSMFSHFRFSSF